MNEHIKQQTSRITQNRQFIESGSGSLMIIKIKVSVVNNYNAVKLKFCNYRYEDVRSEPSWAAKDLEAELELGKTTITFFATSPFSKESASCSFTVHVRDTIPPRVYNCPTDFNVYLKNNEKEKEVILTRQSI